MGNGRAFNLNINSILNIVTLIILATMWFGAIRAHVDDNAIHNEFKELSDEFIPRSELDQIIKRIDASTDRLEKAIEKMENK